MKKVCLLLSTVLLAVGWCNSLALGQPPSASDKAAIGFTTLQAQLGAAMPTGQGVGVTQIETNANGTPSSAYFPNTALADFHGQTIVDVTGSGTTSTHATLVGQSFYGSQSLAPGITNIRVYQADDWLGAGLLNSQAEPGALSNLAPLTEVNHVENLSAVGSVDNGGPKDIDALRRLDLVINRDQVVAVMAVDNGSTTPIPPLMAGAYNAIAVGLSNGQSSVGPTTVDTPGGLSRSKPDLVAPASETSFSTPLVAGAAALLLDAAGQKGFTDATHPETVKALLMAGATKSQFPTWTHSPTQPLDPQYGAGQLNIDHSYQILAAGQQPSSPSRSVTSTGWDYSSLTADTSNTYFFDVTQAGDFTALLTWNRQIALTPGEGGGSATLTPTLADMDLKLFAASGFSTVGSAIQESISTTDNVQLVYEPTLAVGSYALEVDRTTDSLPGSWDYAVAWQVVPEPSSLVALTSGALLFGGYYIHRRWRRARSDGRPRATTA